MRAQRDPTIHRLRTLVDKNPRITFELTDVKASSLGRDETAALDRIRALLEDGKGFLADIHRRSSAAKAVELNEDLAELCGRIGGELRPLNHRGIYVAAGRRSETRPVTDPESDTVFRVIEEVLELTVLKRDAAA